MNRSDPTAIGQSDQLTGTYLSYEEQVALLDGAVGLQEVRLEVHVEQVSRHAVVRSRDTSGKQTPPHARSEAGQAGVSVEKRGHLISTSVTDMNSSSSSSRDQRRHHRRKALHKL